MPLTIPSTAFTPMMGQPITLNMVANRTSFPNPLTVNGCVLLGGDTDLVGNGGDRTSEDWAILIPSSEFVDGVLPKEGMIVTAPDCPRLYITNVQKLGDVFHLLGTAREV